MNRPKIIQGIEGPKASVLSLGIIQDLEGRPINPPRRSYTEEDVARMERTIDIMLFDKEVVSAVLEGREHVAMGIVGAKRNDPGTLVWDGGELEVFWVDPGEEFMIHEYDGWESLRKKGEILFFTA